MKDIKEIKYVYKSIQDLGIEKTKSILLDWVYSESPVINSINSNEMAIIGGYSKWTFLTDASLQSIYSFIDYMHHEFTKNNKKHNKKIKDKINFKFKKFTDIIQEHEKERNF